MSENSYTHVLSLTLFCFLHVSHMAKCSSGPISPQSVWLPSLQEPQEVCLSLFCDSPDGWLPWGFQTVSEHRYYSYSIFCSLGACGALHTYTPLNMPLVLICASQGCTIVFSQFAFFWDYSVKPMPLVVCVSLLRFQIKRSLWCLVALFFLMNLIYFLITPNLV